MTSKEKLNMRMGGATYQQIADVCGTSKQAVQQAVTRYDRRIKKRIRGKGFPLDKIKYKGIYDHFVNNKSETLTSFVCKVYGSGTYCQKMSQFLKGEHDSHFKLGQIKKICNTCGKTFEEVFAERDIDE